MKRIISCFLIVSSVGSITGMDRIRRMLGGADASSCAGAPSISQGFSSIPEEKLRTNRFRDVAHHVLEGLQAQDGELYGVLRGS